MNRIEANKTFDNKTIRVVRDNEQQEWYFSVVDVVEVLADSTNPTDYLKKLRKRDPELKAYIGTNCPQVLMTTESGKPRKTLAANPEHLLYIIQSISSPKEEQFKQWVEQITKSDQAEDMMQLPAIEDVRGEILLYQPDETVRLEVLMEHETVWLTISQMAVLFDREESNIRRHIINVFKERELERNNNVQNLHVNGVKKPLPFYTLDVIISVGYRVKSQRGIKFRQWANKVIKNYLLRGYAINQQLLRLEQRIDTRLDAQQRYWGIIQRPWQTPFCLRTHGNRQEHYIKSTIEYSI